MNTQAMVDEKPPATGSFWSNLFREKLQEYDNAVLSGDDERRRLALNVLLSVVLAAGAAGCGAVLLS